VPAAVHIVGRITMKQSPLLLFESSAFAIVPGEDERTNPGIYGSALAAWLAEQLRSSGVPAGTVIAEDFGWCIPVQSKPHSLYRACANGEKPGQGQLFLVAEGGLWARMLGKDRSAESVASLFAAVRRCVESAPGVQGLREETSDDRRTQHVSKRADAEEILRSPLRMEALCVFFVSVRCFWSAR
jgi:hypothetical protein